MKASLLALFVAIAGFLGVYTLSRPAAVPSAELGRSWAQVSSPALVDTVSLHIEGMTCGGCTLATREVLERLHGVTKVEVSYQKKRAVVGYDPAKVTVAQMLGAVATLEYTATVISP